MAKRYIYNNEVFNSEYAVRQAIWEKEHKVFGRIDVSSNDVIVEEYEQASVTVQPSDDEVAESVRLKRDRLLTASDYYLMPDYPATEDGLVDVKLYRQSLRDVTKQVGFPRSVVWPKIPFVLRS